MVNFDNVASEFGVVDVVPFATSALVAGYFAAPAAQVR
jgi:hypothetical protein